MSKELAAVLYAALTVAAALIAVVDVIRRASIPDYLKAGAR